jgi:hypothetical protein
MNLADALTIGLTKQAGVSDFLSNQKAVYTATRADDSGIKQFLANSELFKDRVHAGAKGGSLAGLIGAVIGGLAGLGLGAVIGEPLMAALVGAMTGSGAGFLLGNAAGQTGVDKAYLKEHGIDSHIPFPVRPLALPFTVGAATPLGSHLQYTTTASGGTK